MAPTFHEVVKEALEQAELAAVGGSPGEVMAAQFVALLDISRKMATKIDDLNATLARPGDPEPRRHPLTKARGIEKVPNFSGSKAEFIDWTKRVEIFIGDTPELKKMLKDIKTEYRNGKVDDDVLSELQRRHGKKEGDVEWYSGQVHSVLMMITTGTPHSLVDICDDNGFEAWRKLHEEYANITPQGKRSLLGRVLNFKKAKGYEDLLAVQAEWERAVIKYSETEGTQKLSEDVLITAYMHILPEKVAESLRNLDKEYDTLTAVKGYVRKQVNAHVNPVLEAKPVPMDIGAVDDQSCENHDHDRDCSQAVDDETANYIASLVRMKGGGKGGRAPMDVDEGMKCYHCGEVGHRKANCPTLDRVMSEWRSKGAGKDKGKGKGGWKGDWGRNPWASGWKGGGSNNPWASAWKGGWSNANVYPSYSKGKGKGEGGKGKGKGLYGKGLYGLDGPTNHEASWWEEEEPAFGLFLATETDDTLKVRSEAAQQGGRDKGLPRAAPTWNLRVQNSFSELSADDDGEESANRAEDYPKADDAHDMMTKRVKMPRFQTTSSKQGAKKKEKRLENDIQDMLNYLDIDDEPGDSEGSMYAVGESWSGKGEWVKVASVVDSGAAEHVASREMAPNVRIAPSAGSRRGQKYVAANGESMANEGEQALQVMTEEGAATDMTFQITDVRRPLCSVGKICDRGNRVIFGRGGGVIHNLKTGRLTPFKRQSNIYTLDFWVRQDEENGCTSSLGFTRQG